MTKTFEDYFSEAQADMVAICMEYSEGKAQEIYIYGANENMYSFKVFFKIQDKVLHQHKLDKIEPDIDTSSDRQKGMLRIGLENLMYIHEICEEYNRDMPTEIKLRYNVEENSLNAKYKYDLVYSNQEDTSPNDIFDQWYEEIKNENEK